MYEKQFIESLLNKLKAVYKTHEENRKSGEQFNIFSSLYKPSEEVRLHSRFLSVLLQPKGSHGFEDCFLNGFLEEVNKSGIIMDACNTDKLDDKKPNKDIDNSPDLILYSITNTTEVYPKEWNKKEINNIDILVIDRKEKKAIIIENKINAGDSNSSGGQLDRYICDVIEKEGINDISVVYLTLDGHSPTAKSVGSYFGKKDIILISYANTIIPWLENCRKKTEEKKDFRPNIQSSLIQYISLVKEMTNTTINKEELQEISSIISKDDKTIKAAKYLIDNHKHIHFQSIIYFWDELKTKLEENDADITKEVDTNAVNKLVYQSNSRDTEKHGLEFTMNDTFKLFIWHGSNQWLYWGIYKNNLNISSIDKMQHHNDYHWNYIECKDNNKIWLKDFKLENTFNLVHETFRKELIDDIVGEIKGVVGTL